MHVENGGPRVIQVSFGVLWLLKLATVDVDVDLIMEASEGKSSRLKFYAEKRSALLLASFYSGWGRLGLCPCGR